MSQLIRVFVTDDHSIVRKGIKATLELVPDMELVLSKWQVPVNLMWFSWTW